MGLCHLSERQAKDLLKRMQGSELLRLEGAGRGAFYRMGARGQKRMKSIRLWRRESASSM